MRRLQGVTALIAVLTAGHLVGCQQGNLLGSSGGSIPSMGTSGGVSTAGTSLDAAGTDMQAADSLRPGHGPCGPLGLPLGIPSGCPFVAGSSNFVCGPDSRGDGLSDTHSYQFLDASGSPQAAYDSVTTASIKFASSVSGASAGHGRWSQVNDSRSLVVTGLAGDEASRAYNGEGSSARQDSLGAPGTPRFLVVCHSTTKVENVVVPKPFARDSWPLSGTITNHVVSRGGARSVDQLSVLKFNGTEFATMVVNDSTFTVDLRRPPHGPGLGGPPPPNGGGGPGGGGGSGGGGGPGGDGPPGGGPPGGGGGQGGGGH